MNSDMSSINPELWDFPHRMTLKVMGAADSPLEQAVVAILTEHVTGFDANSDLSLTPSSKGTYVSVNARVVMETKEQVLAVYGALNACPHVKVVF